MEGCVGCNAYYCSPLVRNDLSALKAYWFASLKGKDDFLILMSDLKIKYYTSGSVILPQDPDLHEKFDWYCSECFLKIMKEKNITTSDWIIE